MEITYDEALIEEIAARFDLRKPNQMALEEIVRRMADKAAGYQEMVADLATGVGWVSSSSLAPPVVVGVGPTWWG